MTGCGSGSPNEAAQAPALVLFISLDTLRADRLDCYGYEREVSPNLSALAADGVRFATVGAQSSQTLISHKSMFHARYPLSLVAEAAGQNLEQMATSDQPHTLIVNSLRSLGGGQIARMSRDGYKTVAFTDGRWMSREMGFGRGFDEFDEEGGGLQRILPKVDAWLADYAGQDAFLFVHTYDIHCPYVSPLDDRYCTDHGRHVRLADKCGRTHFVDLDLTADDYRGISDHYDAGIAQADAQLGDLFQRLKELGLYDEALIVVTSDHGESLGEHDWVGHGELYPEQLLVPLIVKPPASWGLGGRVVDTPVELVDVMPTVRDFCHGEPGTALHGESLLPLMYGEAQGSNLLLAQIAFREEETQLVSPGKRVILNPGRRFAVHDLQRELVTVFDLLRDPGALHGSTEPQSEDLDLLRALFASDPRQGGGETTLGESDVSEELLEQLRALGYVDSE